MQNNNPLNFLVVQLGSIIDNLRKIACGTADDRTWEIVISLNSVVKEWLMIQKDTKIKQLKPDFLARIEGYVSNGDYYKLDRMLDTMQSVINVVEQRITRITGQKDASSKIDPVLLKNNVAVTYDVLKARVGSEQDNETVTDHTICTVEALYEAIRRLIAQRG